MKKYTVTLQHVAYSHITESFPVYAPTLDDAYGIAYRYKGEWYSILKIE